MRSAVSRTPFAAQDGVVRGAHIQHGIGALGRTARLENLRDRVRVLIGQRHLGRCDDQGVLALCAAAKHEREPLVPAGFGKKAFSSHFQKEAACVQLAPHRVVAAAVQAEEGVLLSPARAEHGKPGLPIDRVERKLGRQLGADGRIKDEIQHIRRLSARQHLLPAEPRGHRIAEPTAEPAEYCRIHG